MHELHCGKLLRFVGTDGCDGAVRSRIVLGGVCGELLELSRGELLLGRRDSDTVRVWYLLRLDGPYGDDRRVRSGQLRGRWCDCVHGLLSGILPERDDPSILHSMHGW